MNKNLIDIQKIRPLEKDDVIILTFDPDVINIEDARAYYNYIQSEFPNHKVLGVPKDITIDIKTWKTVVDYLTDIKPQEETSYGER